MFPTERSMFLAKRSLNLKVRNSKPGIRNTNPDFEEFGMRNFCRRNQCPEKIATCPRFLQCFRQRDLCLRQRDPLNVKAQTSKLENWVFSEASKLTTLCNLDLKFQSALWLGKTHLKMQDLVKFARISPPQPRDPSDALRFGMRIARQSAGVLCFLWAKSS